MTDKEDGMIRTNHAEVNLTIHYGAYSHPVTETPVAGSTVTLNAAGHALAVGRLVAAVMENMARNETENWQ